jgi:uncharacterized membrane protein
MGGRTFVAGTALGAAAMYWLDPQAGRRRRALSRQRTMRMTHNVEHDASVLARDFTHRQRGLVSVIGRVLRSRTTTDEVLRERVRARLGRLCSHPGAIEVECQDGRVLLRGPILAEERDRVLRRLRWIEGARDVIDQLEVHSDGNHVPALQGGRPREVGALARLDHRWAPTTRVIAGLAGATLIANGVRRRTRGSFAGNLVGVALIARALGTPAGARYTRVAGRAAVTVRKTLHLRAPIDQVFALWSDPEKFPRFMTHVLGVRRAGERRYQWTVTGPLGASVSWDSEVTELEPERLIAWRSLDGSAVQNTGRVTFMPKDGGTEVQIQLTYCPPGGVLGHALATLFGVGPKKQLDEDLLRFKSLLETGKATGRGDAVTREQTF